jgi:hypothetical protein
MPTIKTIVDEETYARLAKKRQAAGLVSISELFLKQSGELAKKDEARTIVRRAFLRAAQKKVGEEFSLPQLFRPAEWQRFDKSARLRSGRMFKAEVKASARGIRPLRLSSADHQIYLRVHNSIDHKDGLLK